MDLAAARLSGIQRSSIGDGVRRGLIGKDEIDAALFAVRLRGVPVSEVLKNALVGDDNRKVFARESDTATTLVPNEQHRPYITAAVR